MKILNLCTLADFPSFFFKEMEKHTELLLNSEFEDELVENQVFRDLIEKITNFSKGCKIIGYHYTRVDKFVKKWGDYFFTGRGTAIL